MGMVLASALVCLAAVLSLSQTAGAFEPISVSRSDRAVDLTPALELRLLQGESLRISTAPDRDGIVRRVEVRSKFGGDVSNWAVFALANETNEQIDRLIVAPHYRLVGSGIFWPNLDSERIGTITPSEGFSLETVEDREADVFLLTLDPGAVITLIAELKNPKLTGVYLWDADAYKDTVNSYTLYRGIVLGISGLLAVFLTILFVVKGSAVFPATAALAWGVLAYVCVDFGFWDRIISITATNEPVWRAGTEVFLAAALLIFVYTYLHLNRWHRHYSLIAMGWLLGLILLLGVALALPSVASGIARLSFAATAMGGAGLIAYLAFHRYDRAVMLIPTWTLILAWLVGALFTVTGQLSNDIIQPALAGGLVLIVMLLGFTVMQHAFQGGILAEGLVSDVERQALALSASGGIVWDWDTVRDIMHTGAGAAHVLGVSERTLNGPARNWLNLLHPNDRDRLRATLDAIIDHRRGRISQTFRMRSEAGHFHWFTLRARPLLDNSGEVIRCVGTLADVTEAKTAEERLLHDSVRDNLTGLENRQLLVNRLETVLALSRKSEVTKPSVFHINIDNFNEINERLGFGAGDTILLTVARRLGRLLRSGDSLARLRSDRFVLLLTSESAPDKIAAFADSIRKTLRSPLSFADEEMELTASTGIATYAADQASAEDLMRDAELAMIQAKKLGGDRIEPFRPAFRIGRDETTIMQEDLKSAIERKQISVSYQPIVHLEDGSFAGFEALVRWKHPKLGIISPSEFVPIAEQTGFINELGHHVLKTAAQDFYKVNEAAMRSEDAPLVFVSVNISSRELLRHDIIPDISDILKNTGLPPELLRLELTESMVMENPEASTDVLNRIKALGVGLSMDDFGTGYSSLSYLMRLPFDTIKIDRSFLQARDRAERHVVLRSMVAMAMGLDRGLIAEGVETETDVTELLQLGCEYGQGFLFGEPVDLQGVLAMMGEELRQAGQ